MEEEITNSSSKAMMSMKLLVDSKAQRVLYAEEAGEDVVDFLSSLLTLPVATVVKLLSQGSTVASVVKLARRRPRRRRRSDDDVSSAAAAAAADAMNIHLEAPATKLYRCSSSRFSDCHDYVSTVSDLPCQLPECDGKMTLPVKHVLLSSSSLSSSTGNGSSGGEAAAVATYTIMDDLKVAAMSATVLLKSVSMTSTYLQEKTVQIGYIEGLAMLKASLESKTVLTDVFLGKKRKKWPFVLVILLLCLLLAGICGL
uniref:DUF674 domain-containing protein n=2 Tax=Oryza TaxID=4527 RepID=A0A0D9Y2M4_9ORYZ